MTTGNPQQQTFTLSRAQLETEHEMLLDMLVEGGSKDANRDNLRGQIGMVRKILNGKAIGKRDEVPVAKPPEDGERGRLYDGS